MLWLTFCCVWPFLGLGVGWVFTGTALSGCLPLDLEESFSVESTFACASSETLTRFVASAFVLRMDFGCLCVSLADILGEI